MWTVGDSRYDYVPIVMTNCSSVCKMCYIVISYLLVRFFMIPLSAKGVQGTNTLSETKSSLPCKMYHITLKSYLAILFQLHLEMRSKGYAMHHSGNTLYRPCYEFGPVRM